MSSNEAEVLARTSHRLPPTVPYGRSAELIGLTPDEAGRALRADHGTKRLYPWDGVRPVSFGRVGLATDAAGLVAACGVIRPATAAEEVLIQTFRNLPGVVVAAHLPPCRRTDHVRSSAQIALWEAVVSWRPDLGWRFLPWAYTTIRFRSMSAARRASPRGEVLMDGRSLTSYGRAGRYAPWHYDEPPECREYRADPLGQLRRLFPSLGGRNPDRDRLAAADMLGLGDDPPESAADVAARYGFSAVNARLVRRRALAVYAGVHGIRPKPERGADQ